MTIALNQRIASSPIHQFAYALKNAPRHLEILRDIAHPFFVNFVGPVGANDATGRQPHE